jgi:hypothetical protein
MFLALMPVPHVREFPGLAYERNVEGDQAWDRSGNHRQGPGSIAPVALRLPLVLSSGAEGAARSPAPRQLSVPGWYQ